MPETWQQTTLGRLCEDGGTVQTGPFGSQLHAEDYVEGGIPVVMPVNIGDNRIDPAGIARISEADAGRLARHQLRVGDIVYSRRGDVTKRALVREAEAGWLCGTGCLLVRSGAGVDPRWLSYWLGTSVVHEWLTRHAVGATMPNLNTAILADVPVSCPPLAEQVAIADVLAVLDSLTEVNEELATAATETWRALVASALDGTARQRPLSSLARFINGKNFTKNATGAGLPVIRTPEVRRGPTPTTVHTASAVADDFIAKAGDILFVWSGSLMVGRWLYEPGYVNQHIFKVVPAEGVPSWLVFALIERQMPWFLGLAADKATTMGHIQRGHLDVMVPVPDEVDVARLDRLVAPFWEQAFQSTLEANEAAELRRSLVPLLMSRQLRPQQVAA